jgi:hypothetical protein
MRRRRARPSSSTGAPGTTRIELASAMFEYLEIFHNRERRHPALGMLTPIQVEYIS